MKGEKEEKKDIENIGDKEINGKMVDLNLTMSIITLNGNDKNIALEKVGIIGYFLKQNNCLPFT